jgi:ATP adenylyltransferase
MELHATPWRMAYIQRDRSEDVAGCVLCHLHEADAQHDAENLVLLRGEHCYVVLNRYPYNTAHLMVVPYAHTSDLASLPEAVAAELFRLSRRCVALLGEEYHPHGCNLGMNLGESAGAGIAEHLHMHVVPRWSGDTNFYPLIGGIKALPEALDQTYARLRPLFARQG